MIVRVNVVLNRTQVLLTLKMTTAQVVETSVTVHNNSPIQDYIHPDDQTRPYDHHYYHYKNYHHHHIHNFIQFGFNKSKNQLTAVYCIAQKHHSKLYFQQTTFKGSSDCKLGYDKLH